ncbi:MAG: RNA polymerase sigma factor [Oscillospiraceae bacterium]|jgi:RNA polymerase sigma factor (sigma-70 family)
MDLLRHPSLERLPDPHTDPRLLPAWMRREENRQEAACYRTALRLAMEDVLTPEQSQVIHMRFWLGMPVAEIGRELGITGSAVSKRIAGALKILRHQVEFCVRVVQTLQQQESQQQ